MYDVAGKVRQATPQRRCLLLGPDLLVQRLLRLPLRQSRARHSVEAQVQIEMNVRKRFIILQIQALKASAVDMGPTWGEPGVNLG